MLLESFGADAALFGAFQSYASQGLLLARVSFSHRDSYRLIAESEELDAETSGAFWFRASSPAAQPVAGDWVAVRTVAPGHALIEAVLPRRTCFSRRAAGKREQEQPLAANIDLVFLVCGLDGDFNPRRLERYLALTAASGAQPVVVLNKADLRQDTAGCIQEISAISNGAPVVATSTRGTPGTHPLLAFLTVGRTVALLGSSGVGKSSLANALAGESHLRTGEVREADSRGRHTTTHRQLIALPAGGILIDTPGLRELQLWAGVENVEETFDEIAASTLNCRFRNCSHGGEPGCAIAAALEIGSILPERWQSYRKLLREALRHERLADPLLAVQEKRKLKRMHKAYRNWEKR